MFSGQFQFDSVICRLLQTDLSPSEDQIFSSQELDFLAATIGEYASRSQDVITSSPLPDSLQQTVNATLFHEKLHYWQLLACPQVQKRFEMFLYRLNIETEQLGGRTRMLSTHGRYSSKDEPMLRTAERSIDRHFSVRQVNDDRIMFENPVDEYTSMPYILTQNNDDAFVLPCYGARLSYEDGSENLLVFSGTHLLEAAAYLGEQRYRGLAPERLTTAATPERLLYLGVWEFWCRLFSHVYADALSLEVAFLAVIDVSLSTDISIDPSELSMDELAELNSIPYRFGKLSWMARFRPPMELDSVAIPQSVDRWQTLLCERRGWSTPTYCATKAAANLTLALLFARMGHIADTPENIQAIELTRMAMRPGQFDIELLRPAWELIDATRSASPLRVGQAVLGEMLNACWYRTKRPGDFAVASFVADRVGKEFPLPLFLLGGQYYHEPRAWAFSSFGPELPYNHSRGELSEDCIGLATLRPLRNGDAVCGFLRDHVKCYYERSGLGCPLKDLTEDQNHRRKTFGMDNWCHWTKYGVLLDIADRAVVGHWFKRWRQ